MTKMLGYVKRSSLLKMPPKMLGYGKCSSFFNNDTENDWLWLTLLPFK
jgi:hypothetical protein